MTNLNEEENEEDFAPDWDEDLEHLFNPLEEEEEEDYGL